MNAATQTTNPVFPPYWCPDHFAKGQAVRYGEFPAVIVGHYSHGMWEIKMRDDDGWEIERVVSGANITIA